MSDETTIKVIEEVNERKYWTQIPNLIDELELSPYAVRLYLRMKRRAGDNGSCYESSSNLAKGCKMSTHKVVDAKRELQKAGLISINTEKGKHGGRNYHVIQITDIWHDNFLYFTSQVSTGNLQVADMHFARCKYAMKEEPIKNKGENENMASQSLPPYHTSPKPRRVEKCSSSSTSSLINHPAIQAIKQVTGYFPRWNLYKKIIELVGETPDIERLQLTFDTWTANGYNPMDIKGWLFDWYKEGMYYVHPGKKFPECEEELSYLNTV